MVAVARGRIVAALKGLMATPVDDRFLLQAIFANRARRDNGKWVARPEPTASLSTIVLSLFSAAILANRDEYDQALCVCDTCGRVSLDRRPQMRRACPLHCAHGSGVGLGGLARGVLGGDMAR